MWCQATGHQRPTLVAELAEAESLEYLPRRPAVIGTSVDVHRTLREIRVSLCDEAVVGVGHFTAVCTTAINLVTISIHASCGACSAEPVCNAERWRAKNTKITTPPHLNLDHRDIRSPGFLFRSRACTHSTQYHNMSCPSLLLYLSLDICHRSSDQGDHNSCHCKHRRQWRRPLISSRLSGLVRVWL